MKPIYLYRAALFLAIFLWQAISLAQTKPEARAYQTGNYIFCGNEIPKNFTYLIERKEGENWQTIAQLKAPQSETECMAALMQLPPSLAAITTIDEATVAFIWKRIQQSDVIDSIYAYSNDPRYQHMSQTACFDNEIEKAGTYTYRIQKLNKSGNQLAVSEVSVEFPSKIPVSKIKPVRFKLNESSISISYTIADQTSVGGIKLFRSNYLRNNFTVIPTQLIYTNEKGQMVAVLNDNTATKGLTYSYVAQPYDVLGNPGNTTDTLNIYFANNTANAGIISNFKATSIPEKGGNMLSWEINQKMNVKTINLYRSNTFDGPYQFIASLKPGANEYFDSQNLSPAIAYYYYATINNGYTESLPSARFTAILEGKRTNLLPPQDLNIEREGNIVTLNFRKLGTDTKGYYIYRGDGYVAPLKQLPRMLISTDTLLIYTDTLPQTINSMVYSYAVASVNTSYNVSPQSNRVSIAYSGGRLPAPLNVTAMEQNDGIMIKWSNAAGLHAGVSEYRVFRKAMQNNKEIEPEKVIATTAFNQNFYIDKNVQPGRYYSYRVQCIGSDTLDTGAMSMPGNILYKTDALLQPGDITCIPSDGKIILKWTLPIDESLVSSLIYRSTEKGQASLLKELDKNISEYEDRSAKKNEQYYYFVVLKYSVERTSKPSDAVSGKWQ